VHAASFEKMRAFRATYLDEKRGPLRVLDIGSCCGPGSLTYRALFSPPRFEYTGLDIGAGHNVDVVPKDPFSWAELEDESFDVVISGQTFEHNSYFWITAAEIARVLVPGGLTAVIAPSAGHPHRFPVDCWRFYPDSWAAICAYVGLELVESYREEVSWRKTIPGVYWRDAMMVAAKPEFGNEAERCAFYDRLFAIVATRTEAPERFRAPTRAGSRYEAVHTLSTAAAIVRPARVGQFVGDRLSRVKRFRPVKSVLRRMRRNDGAQALERGRREMR
jgi:SAM-dependent methyltransferase